MKTNNQNSKRNQSRTSAKTARERIEALRAAGVDVSNLFALSGSNGGEYVAANVNGVVSILTDNDPIFAKIDSAGYVPNHRLFRRWVMAQMFRMMAADGDGRHASGITPSIHRLGYAYQWKMVMNELKAQHCMMDSDPENYRLRSMWFNKDTVCSMLFEHTAALTEYANEYYREKDGVKIVFIDGRGMTGSDICFKLVKPVTEAAKSIVRGPGHPARLMAVVNSLIACRQLPFVKRFPQSKAWIDAYKGCGAYYTMENLIKYHGCTVRHDDEGRPVSYSQQESLEYIRQMAARYSSRRMGWMMFGMMKALINDNGIDINKKRAEWAQKAGR